MTKEISNGSDVDPLSFRDILCAKGLLGCIILVAVQYIYRNRCLKKQLSIHEFSREVNTTRNIEKYYAVKDNRIVKYFKKWDPVMYQELQAQNEHVMEQLNNAIE